MALLFYWGRQTVDKETHKQDHFQWGEHFSRADEHNGEEALDLRVVVTKASWRRVT